MKKLLLQHWDGDLTELAKRSVKCMSAYAESVGADYKLLRGKVFHDLSDGSPTQKMIILDEQFDAWDIVVMVDCDMFTINRDILLDIFTEEEGFGNHSSPLDNKIPSDNTVQANLKSSLLRKDPDSYDPDCSYWGGSCYRFPLWLRQKLRSVMDKNKVKTYHNSNNVDEGFMFHLNSLAGIKGHYFPSDVRWQFANDWSGIEEYAQFIHIRNKRRINGEVVRADKLECLDALVENNIIKDWS